jgi:hypothetical protein
MCFQKFWPCLHTFLRSMGRGLSFTHELALKVNYFSNQSWIVETTADNIFCVNILAHMDCLFVMETSNWLQLHLHAELSQT